MAKLKHTLTQKQKAVFLKHGFTQALADEVLKRKPFPWTIDHIKQYVLDYNIKHRDDQKTITAKGIETPVTPKLPRRIQLQESHQGPISLPEYRRHRVE